MDNQKKLRRINYLILLIISVIILIIAASGFIGDTLSSIFDIFGAILFLASGYKFLFFKRWEQRVEEERQKKINK